MYEGSTEPRFSQEKERCFIRWTEALRVWWHEINSHRDGNVEREPAIPIERTETEALEEAVRFVVPRLRALAMKGSATVTWAKLDTMVRFELHSQTPTRAVALSLEGLGLLEPIFSPPRNSDRPGASILNIITAGSPSQWRMLPKLLTTQPCEELPSPAENPSAEVPELVDDLSLLRNEVIALHDPGTSRKANGDTVSKIIATPGLTERIAGYGKGTDRASLARFLQSCLQPKKKPGDRPA